MKFGICACSDASEKAMINACIENNVSYEVIDLLSNDWLKKCKDSSLCGFLIQPPCNYEEHKQIYDERAYVIANLLKKETYPSFNELYVYENKRNMSYWCETYNLPHPKTSIFTSLDSVKVFLADAKYPLVSKSNVGAGGTSVRIINSQSEALSVAKKIFGRFHPEFSFGYTPIGHRGKIPFPRVGRTQKHYMICQEFLSIKWEWRIIRIGDSYFGHQKLLGENNKASGSLLVGWEKPPLELLELVRDFTEKSSFRTVALDIFETYDKQFYVNEIQPLIGAHAPSQMYIDGTPGRYRYIDNNFLFESGEFCKNKCWDIRVEDFTKLIKGKEKK